MRGKFISEYQFQGTYVEQLADGREKVHVGVYFVTELKSRYLVSFKPFGFEYPLFVDFCILKNKNLGPYVVEKYIEDNWQWL